MHIAFFSTKSWVNSAFAPALAKYGYTATYFDARLNIDTVSLAAGHDAVCVFVNDILDAAVIKKLSELGVRAIALRCAGFNNVDLKTAVETKIPVVRVPSYSPYAVAEHALGLILSLNRKFHRSYPRVRDGNFALDGLLGFDLHDKTIGIIGTGKIGQIFAKLMGGFGVKLLAYDRYPSDAARALGVEYVDLERLYNDSDIISLHCPLTHDTYHMINDYAISAMKENVMIINTSRGPLIDTNAVIAGLKSAKVGYLGLDVYEEEQDLFFENLSDQVIQDDTFVRLLTFPNVLITGHQAFFTKEAIDNIAQTTLDNLRDISEQGQSANVVLPVNGSQR